MSNIQKNPENKIISPAQVVLLLLRIKRAGDRGTCILSRSLQGAFKNGSPSHDIIKTVQYISQDNPDVAIEMFGEDLFNDINDVKKIPNYTADELHNGRGVLIYGGRGYGKTSYVRYLSI